MHLLKKINNAIKITKYTKQKDSRVKLMIWLKTFNSFWTKKKLSWKVKLSIKLFFNLRLSLRSVQFMYMNT